VIFEGREGGRGEREREKEGGSGWVRRVSGRAFIVVVIVGVVVVVVVVIEAFRVLLILVWQASWPSKSTAKNSRSHKADSL
jgi:hypothetical protein